MAQKRKSTNNNWKPMTIECNDCLNVEDFDDLVAIEELDDYQIIRNVGDLDKKLKSNDELKKMKKKKKKKKLNNFKVESVNDKIVQDEIVDKINDEIDDQDMSKWKELSVPKSIIKCLKKLRMTIPTPIQSATIPLAINDHLNIYGAAPTGSGKTLAFAIPIVTKILNDNDNNKLLSIIITPTRELAVQIKQNIDNICKFNLKKINIALIIGGLSIQKQERLLLSKSTRPQIIVATPGRLWEIIEQKKISLQELSTLKSFVIDEADRIIEKLHFNEFKLIINYLNQNVQQMFNKCQLFIFSATLINNNNNNSMDTICKLLNLNHKKFKIFDLTDSGKQCKPTKEYLSESIVYCLNDEKDLYLYYFLRINLHLRIIVFFNSIDCIRRVSNIFKFLQLNPLSIHSSMTQKQRLKTIEKFNSNGKLLFATDLVSRGLDLLLVNYIIHYQLPRTMDIYIHRIGRTARINNYGSSLIICDPYDDVYFFNNNQKNSNKNYLDKNTLNEFKLIQNQRLFKYLRQCLNLAKLCDQYEYKDRKNLSEKNWFKQMAKQCDLINDDYSIKNNLNDEELILCKKNLKFYKQQLSILLRQQPKQLTQP